MPVTFAFPRAITSANIRCIGSDGVTIWGPYDINSSDGTTVVINLPDMTYSYTVIANYGVTYSGSMTVAGGNASVVLVDAPDLTWVVLVAGGIGALAIGIYIWRKRKR